MMKRIYRKAAAGLLTAGILANCTIPVLAAQPLLLTEAPGFPGESTKPVPYRELAAGCDYYVVTYVPDVDYNPNLLVPAYRRAFRLLNIYVEDNELRGYQRVKLLELFTGIVEDHLLGNCDFYELPWSFED